MNTMSGLQKRKGFLKGERKQVTKKLRSEVDTSGIEDGESSKSSIFSDATQDTINSNSLAGPSHTGFRANDEKSEDDTDFKTDHFEDEPFPHLDTDRTQHTREHVNHIILLDTSLMPDGAPTGVFHEMMLRDNYPHVDPSTLNVIQMPFLIRNCALAQLEFFKDLRGVFDKLGWFGNVGKVIRGSAGAGKSYVLYHVVNFCRASGWLVLYIPRAGKLGQLSQAAAAKTILMNFLKAEKDKLEKIKTDKTVNEPISRYFGINEEQSQNLSLAQLDYPVLVAVDEWNARCSPKYVNNKVLNLFTKNKLRSGFWLYAISSSFVPYEEFRNADAQTIMIDIPSYDMNSVP
ncbi:mitochondrial 37S ribosomal protein mS29 [Calcarisporiella thermophila]|uniref:mitochondrial 37S ribosomal protein mS29 n=1 Tax=Calcarisporiella thermophila TaxID=911321 RepID=UPI00374238D0